MYKFNQNVQIFFVVLAGNGVKRTNPKTNQWVSPRRSLVQTSDACPVGKETVWRRTPTDLSLAVSIPLCNGDLMPLSGTAEHETLLHHCLFPLSQRRTFRVASALLESLQEAPAGRCRNTSLMTHHVSPRPAKKSCAKKPMSSGNPSQAADVGGERFCAVCNKIVKFGRGGSANWEPHLRSADHIKNAKEAENSGSSRQITSFFTARPRAPPAPRPIAAEVPPSASTSLAIDVDELPDFPAISDQSIPAAAADLGEVLLSRLRVAISNGRARMTYNLKSHIERIHPGANLVAYKSYYSKHPNEKIELKRISKAKTRTRRKKAITFRISEEHSTQSVLGNGFLQADSGALSDEEDANIDQDEYNNAQDDNDDQADNCSSSDFPSRVAEDSNDEMDSSEPPTLEQAPIFAPSGYLSNSAAPYGGSANVPSSSRMNNLPPDLGGRSSHDTAQMTASPPNQYPQSSYRTAPYGSSPTIPRLPPGTPEVPSAVPTIQAMTPVHATATPGQSTDNFSNMSTPVISDSIPLTENNSGLTPMDPDPQIDEENDSGKRVRRVPRPKRSRKQAILSDDEKDCDDPDCTETGDLETITCSGPACTSKFHLCCRGLKKKPTGAWYCDGFCRENAGGRARIDGDDAWESRLIVYRFFLWVPLESLSDQRVICSMPEVPNTYYSVHRICPCVILLLRSMSGQIENQIISTSQTAMSTSRFGLCCPAPALQATVPPEIVKSQDVHVWNTGSRAQNQDFIYVKFLPPTLCGPHAPTSENAALPMSADEAAVVLRSTCAVQTCEKTLKTFPLEPPFKLSSARASGPHDTEYSHEKCGHAHLHEGGAAIDSFFGHVVKFLLPAHIVHGPSTELGPAGDHPVSTRTSPLGLILISKAALLAFILVLTLAARVDAWILIPRPRLSSQI
ncbi:hypothetical protein C8J57DRAFT_1673758 [Mycena rebaudengoi]|nr:hypothetical protein C8J57DRAFT_1673758 [Mycena rebaudengoi]